MRLARALRLIAIGAACRALAGCDQQPAGQIERDAPRERMPARAWQQETLAHSDRFLVLLDRPRPDFTLPGAHVTRRFSLVPGVAIAADRAGLRAMQADPRILAIEPDEGGSGLLAEAEPLIGLDQVKTAGFTGTGITVAVIDSGIDGSHPALAGRVIDEACFCGTDCCPNGQATQIGPGAAMDDNGHGTHVAGAIASQGVSSPEGGAPGVQLVAVKVLDSQLAFCCMSDVIDALGWVATNHPEVKLINVSLGANSLWMGDCDALYTVLSASIGALRQNGTLVIAASGNDSVSTAMRSPACVSSAISVGAVWDADSGDQHEYCDELTTAADKIACYSNASSTTDLLAPGGVITSSWLGGGTQSLIGTSHAAPMVTACAATLRQAKPTLSADELESLLESSGRPLTDARNGLVYPRVDCKAALDAPLPSVDAGTSEDAGSDQDAGSTKDAGSALTDAGTRLDAGDGSGGGTSHDHDAAIDAGDHASNPDAGHLRDAGTRDSGHAVDTTDAAQQDTDAATTAHPAVRITHLGGTGCACRTLEADGSPDPIPFSLLAWLGWRRRKR